jgi:hypothetical protein
MAVILKNRVITYFAVVLCLASFECQSQNGFAVGFKGGSGVSVFPVHPVFTSNSIEKDVRINPQVHTGVVIQYEIAEKAGIESGCQIMYHSYSLKDGGSYLKKNINQSNAITVTDFQIPILLTYNVHHRYNASRYLKLAAGTSLDWLSTDLFIAWQPPVSVKNLIIGIRGGKILEYGKIEFALEHQYSLNRYMLSGVNYDQLNDRITTRISFLNFSVMYFLPAKLKSTTL